MPRIVEGLESRDPRSRPAKSAIGRRGAPPSEPPTEMPRLARSSIFRPRSALLEMRSSTFSRVFVNLISRLWDWKNDESEEDGEDRQRRASFSIDRMRVFLHGGPSVRGPFGEVNSACVSRKSRRRAAKRPPRRGPRPSRPDPCRRTFRGGSHERPERLRQVVADDVGAGGRRRRAPPSIAPGSPRPPPVAPGVTAPVGSGSPRIWPRITMPA